MQDAPHRSEAPSPNAFSPAFLGRLADLDEPVTALAASSAGPWGVRPHGAQFAVMRQWEDAESGDEAFATFRCRETALVAAAALTALAHSPGIVLSGDRSEQGFVFERAGGEIGALALYDGRLADALDLLTGVLSSPTALAALLEAAGATALEAAGRIASRAIHPS